MNLSSMATFSDDIAAARIKVPLNQAYSKLRKEETRSGREEEVAGRNFVSFVCVPIDSDTLRKMGIIRSSFSFMFGTVCGVYIAQNYNVPNIKRLFDTGIFMARHVEESYRKPKKKDDD
ncbi:hypothetical protein EJ110_NYTH28658 [Nymphaea thermarum]|nr:hypothetical protein EJ110_NYTH28658 [Nymphaea thermarum]